MRKATGLLFFILNVASYASAFDLDAPSSAGRMRIRFSAGTTCSVERCSALTGGWNAVTSVVLTNDVMDVDVPLTGDVAFYRLSYQTPYPVVFFAESSLRDIVRSAVTNKHMPTNWLYTADVEAVTNVNAFNNGTITNLTGLEYLSALQTLSLGGNHVADVTALGGLTKLTSLTLSDNAITNIAALTNLVRLKTLILDFNMISDISPLSGLTNLTNLGCGFNQITNIDPIVGLTRLTRLQISNNNFADISPAAALTNLTDLYIPSSAITNLEQVANWTKLKRLNIGDNGLTNIYFLHTLTNLNAVWISQNNISDVSVLANFPKMDSLFASHVPATNFSVLAGSSLLKHVELDYTGVKDIGFVGGLTNLIYLDISGCSVSNLDAVIINAQVGGLGTGNDLYLSGNPLSSFAQTNQIPVLRGTYGIDVFWP
jgi:Leucine-rich repeat (LRR) protein